MTVEQLLKRRDDVNRRINVTEGQAAELTKQKDAIAEELLALGINVKDMNNEQLSVLKQNMEDDINKQLIALEEAITDAESKLS